MKTPQTNNPQKTSFWDFRHKKVYVSSREQIADFICGLIGAPIFVIILFSLIEYLISFIYPVFWPKLLGYIFLYGIIVFCLLLLIYGAIKRKYIFYGMLLSSILFLIGAMLLTSN